MNSTKRSSGYEVTAESANRMIGTKNELFKNTEINYETEALIIERRATHKHVYFGDAYNYVIRTTLVVHTKKNIQILGTTEVQQKSYRISSNKLYIRM